MRKFSASHNIVKQEAGMKTGEQNKQYDLVILNGTVIDVEEEQFIKANIGISGSEIEVITPDPISGRHEIDATGKMISP